MIDASFVNRIKIMAETNFWNELDSRKTFIKYNFGLLFLTLDG